MESAYFIYLVYQMKTCRGMPRLRASKTSMMTILYIIHMI